MTEATITIGPPAGAADWDEFERLVREYLRSLPFEVDFQDIEGELADLPGFYGPPGGGALLAAVDGRFVGSVGVHSYAGTDGELKRMYVRPEGRGLGLGRRLAVTAIELARALGYRRLLLDTLDSLVEAVGLYRSLGFVEIDAYRYNPRPDVRYFALDL